ncbi:MAG: hypothetical protein U0360_02375 [Dehalococcoidia bacterium]
MPPGITPSCRITPPRVHAGSPSGQAMFPSRATAASGGLANPSEFAIVGAVGSHERAGASRLVASIPRSCRPAAAAPRHLLPIANSAPASCALREKSVWASSAVMCVAPPAILHASEVAGLGAGDRALHDRRDVEQEQLRATDRPPAAAAYREERARSSNGVPRCKIEASAAVLPAIPRADDDDDLAPACSMRCSHLDGEHRSRTGDTPRGRLSVRRVGPPLIRSWWRPPCPFVVMGPPLIRS